MHTGQETVGLVAGGGRFPFLAAEGARKQGFRVAAVGYKGHVDPGLAGYVDEFKLIHLGKLNALISFFTKRSIKRVAFAGAVNKPKALDLRPDMRALRLLFRLRHKGDDILLRAVIAELESEGLEVVQAASFIPSLRAGQGVLSKRSPTDQEWEDIHLGLKALNRLGGMDIGQCIVIKKGVIAAVEAIEGTDACIRRGGELAGPGAVIVKAVKPGQDERIDLPALGLQTLQTIQSIQGACLAYIAEKTLFFDREESLQAADNAGIAVIGLAPNSLDTV